MSGNHDHIKNLPAWKAARLACFERDDETCVDCGATADLQADHEIPLAVLFAEGVTPEAIALAVDVDNLRTRCGPCNRTKGATTDVVVIRHTWISPRYMGALSWLEGEPTEVEEVDASV